MPDPQHFVTPGTALDHDPALDSTAGWPGAGEDLDATLLATARAVADLHALEPHRIPRHWTGRDRFGRRCQFDAQERRFILKSRRPAGEADAILHHAEGHLR